MADTAERLMYEHMGSRPWPTCWRSKSHQSVGNSLTKNQIRLKTLVRQSLNQLVGIGRIMQSRASGMPDGGFNESGQRR